MPSQDAFPFMPCFAVDCNLSITAVEHAYGVWCKAFDTLPSVLWVAPTEVGYAERILGATGLRLVILADPAYGDRDWWSVGSRLDKGFGSVGASS